MVISMSNQAPRLCALWMKSRPANIIPPLATSRSSSCSGSNSDSSYVQVGAPPINPSAPPLDPERQTHPQQDKDDNFKCPICLDLIDPDEGVMRCSRGHYFHSGCLQEWIQHARSHGGATCPLCGDRSKCTQIAFVRF